MGVRSRVHGQKSRPVLLKSFKNLQVVIWAPQLGTLVLSVQHGEEAAQIAASRSGLDEGYLVGTFEKKNSGHLAKWRAIT